MTWVALAVGCVLGTAAGIVIIGLLASGGYEDGYRHGVRDTLKAAAKARRAPQELRDADRRA